MLTAWISLLSAFVPTAHAGGPNLAWVKRAGGAAGSYAFGASLALDANRNIYITGGFSESVIFGAGEPNQTVLAATGFEDAFMAKYSANGNLLWAKRAGGATGAESGFGIALDGSGTVT